MTKCYFSITFGPESWSSQIDASVNRILNRNDIFGRSSSGAPKSTLLIIEFLIELAGWLASSPQSSLRAPSEFLQNSLKAFSKFFQSPLRTPSDLFQGCFRTQSDIAQSSSHAHSELHDNSLRAPAGLLQGPCRSPSYIFESYFKN